MAELRRRDLGDRTWRPPRALQAHGLPAPRPGPAHRLHPPHPDPQVARWRAERDAIAAEIMSAGFNILERGSHPQLRFERPRRRRARPSPWTSNRATSPGSGPPSRPYAASPAGGPLPYRYPPGQDGLLGTEGAFLPRSFWLVQALASTGRVDEAAQLFADLLELANPLGLLPEEINPRGHRYLGNYPQALTHAALIQAALAIRDA